MTFFVERQNLRSIILIFCLGLLCSIILFSQVTLGQRRGISATDAQQMNLLYKSQCGGGGGGGGGGGVGGGGGGGGV